MAINFEQIIRLMKKTGEKFIFNQNDENFIVLTLDEYEKLLSKQDDIRPVGDLTEDELVDKINREIAQWRTTQTNEIESDFFEAENDLVNSAKNEEDDQYYLEPVD